MQLADGRSGRLVLNCSGGLGNQMFEYAAGLFFREKFHRTLEIVRPILRQQNWNGYPRPFQLSQFRVRSMIRVAGYLERFFFSSNPRVKTLHGPVGSVLGAQLLEEPAVYKFEPEIKDDPSKRITYMTGNWQAAGYVQATEAALREEFTLPPSSQVRNRRYAEQIQDMQCPVSLHLRIGDYVHHLIGAGGSSIVLGLSYYERAITEVSALFPKHTLVVFSDEMAKAKELLAGRQNCLFVEGNDASTAHEDLRLMSLCRHHIIANSSFSWWGAWLNPNPAKRVFAPKYWANNLTSYFPDLYPPGWTIIDNL